MTEFEIGDEEYTEEVNTSYDQEQPIGDTPSHYPAGGAEPIDAKLGQDFMDIDLGEETVPITQLTDDELLEKREYMYGLGQSMGYLTKIEEEIKNRGLGNPDWKEDDKAEENWKDVANVLYNQEIKKKKFKTVWQQIGYESLANEMDDETRRKIVSDIERSESPEHVDDLIRWAGNLGVNPDDYIKVFEEGGYMFEEELAHMYGEESLNKDGTGVQHATRGVNPNNPKYELLKFIYVSKSNCPTCKQYDGKTFHKDDPDRPIIPRLESGYSAGKGYAGSNFTHPHCKCKWVYVFNKAGEARANEIKQSTLDRARKFHGKDFDKLTSLQQKNGND